MHSNRIRALAALTFLALAAPSARPAENLALGATATASEQQDQLAPPLAIDGDPNTRWSGIPGHVEGVWFELDWPKAIAIGEVVLHQFDRYVVDLDVQAWDAEKNDWRTVEHVGRRDRRLPAVVISRFDPVTTTKLRIGNITNGPSFTEVEVHARPFEVGLAIAVASDLAGNAIGMVTDPFGAAPVVGAEVVVSGRTPRGDWTRAAATDADGQFAAPLPHDASGPISFSVRKADATTERALDASAFQLGLTPRDASTTVVALDGPWRFSPDPPAAFERPDFDDHEWAQIAVPGHWEMQGFRTPGGQGGYRTHFRCTPGADRVKLQFDGVYSGAFVAVNGTLVAVHDGGATPFECDVTSALVDGDNVLAVRVSERTPASDGLDQMSAYADFSLGGIIRAARLVRVPAAHVAAIAIATEFDAAFQDATIRGSVTLLNESDAPLAAGALRLALAAPDAGATGATGATLAAATPIAVALPAHERVIVPIELKVTAPAKWDPEHPRLHVLSIELADGAATVQRLAQRIGFRQTTIRGPQLLVNGSPVKIRGTCHHDSHPLVGRAVTPELTRTDLSMMKAANLNALRTSHYPPIPELLDIADELGLFVEDEAPFCWVSSSNDLRLAPRIRQLTAELLARDRNHPCVFMWSLCNESEFGRGFELAEQAVRAADPSRPLGAATSAWLDIATLHNPMTVARIDEQENLDKPLLFDESLAPFQGIWSDAGEMWIDPGIRDAWIEPLIPVFERFLASRATQGSLIWAWSDDLFCVPGRGIEYGRGGTRSHFVDDEYSLPGRGICGDAPWGLVDGWRRAKPEYWLTRKLHTPVKLAEAPLALPAFGAPIRVPVENRFDFTDLTEVKFAWRLVDETGTATTTSIPPHARGELTIAPRRAPKAGESLEIEVTDPAGRVVDEARIPFGERVLPDPPGAPPRVAPLLLREEFALAGHATAIIGQDFEIAIDRGTGLLRRAVVRGEPVLLELPSIHVLESGRPFASIPDRTTWRPTRIDVAAEDENVHVHVFGEFDSMSGDVDCLVTPAGEMLVAASFTWNGPEIAVREVGIRLAGPRGLQMLEWSRRAEWSVYPDDAIGRPHGRAIAFPDHAVTLPPSWPWAQDVTPMGSNDFRSTKRGIDWALLGGARGAGFVVRSDGSQAVRACVESDRTALYVNDWSGGTGAGLGEWEQNYGRGRGIKKGDRVDARCRIALRLAAP